MALVNSPAHNFQFKRRTRQRPIPQTTSHPQPPMTPALLPRLTKPPNSPTYPRPCLPKRRTCCWQTQRRTTACLFPDYLLQPPHTILACNTTTLSRLHPPHQRSDNRVHVILVCHRPRPPHRRDTRWTWIRRIRRWSRGRRDVACRGLRQRAPTAAVIV